MVISVAHQKGGVGKSTIAANLAVLLHQIHGEAFRVIDLDVQRSLSYFNAKRKRNNRPELPIMQVDSVGELRELMKDDTGITLIDVGGFDSDVNRMAMLYSDLIITPVSDSPFELGGLLKFRDIIRDLRVARPDLVATVLLNNIHQFASRSLDEIFEFCRATPEFEIFNTTLRHRSAYKKSINEGRSVAEFEPFSKAFDEIKQLEGEINVQI
jgi:chromosome partitioning protein